MAKKIALTFDDAPMYGGPLLTGEERTQMLLDALASVGAQATFFAATHDLEVPNAMARLAAYNDAGHLIANHTNTHAAASNTSVSDFLNDVSVADGILSGFSNYRSWFRFPYLDEGNTVGVRDAYRDGLEGLGLENGYVTADTFDWYLVDRLSNAITNGDYYDLDGFRDAFVDMIVSSANYFDALGQTTLGRSPVQTLLLHENDLAAMFIDDAILALEADGWEIVSADEAYADPLADIEPITLQSGSGLLGAIAIDQGADFSVLVHESNTTEGLDAMLAEHNALAIGGPVNQIIGTSGDDVLFGTVGDDELEGLSGNDVFNESLGDDVVYGGSSGISAPMEYDQMDYNGSLSDYTFTRDAAGVITVVKPNGDVDTLYSIEGFWFSGEGAWYSADQAVGTASDIVGTFGDDYLVGTSQDELIFGLTGSDKIAESAGNDTIDGGGSEYDQVDYNGNLSDYVFSLNADNSVSVTKPGGGVDTLTNIDGFWFGAEAAWYRLDQALNSSETGAVIIGTSGDDVLFGTGGDDAISGLSGTDIITSSSGNDVIDGGGNEYDQVDYSGSESDYIFTRNANGSVSVEKPDGAIDTLTDIDGFWFSGEGAWYSLEETLDDDALIFGQGAPSDFSYDFLG
ncbi:MAG: polysaccharide deacetylase family protein [Hyphomonas sp.]